MFQALFQCCFNTHLHHSGDYVNPDESTIIIINHPTRVDWNYVWIALYHATHLPEKCICKEKLNGKQYRTENSLLDLGGKSKTKFVLKDEIKNIPGMGNEKKLSVICTVMLEDNFQHLFAIFVCNYVTFLLFKLSLHREVISVSCRTFAPIIQIS